MSETSTTEASAEWQYQVRLYLADDAAAMARSHPHDPSLAALNQVLERHKAALKCQYDAFADYVAAADAEGIENYPLAEWTRATIEDPIKKAKYIKAFTVYIGGEVYEKSLADALEADLAPLVGGDLVTQMTKHDTNPANNPQMPERFRQS